MLIFGCAEPAKAASAAPSEAPKQSKGTDTVALRSPTAVPAAKDTSLDKEQPAAHAAEQKEPVKVRVVPFPLERPLCELLIGEPMETQSQ